MATIKSFTSLEQSKKLAEILPLESADMYIDSTNPYYIHTELRHLEYFDSEHHPCWSLAALLKIIGHYTLQTVSNDKKVFIISEENHPICSDDYPEPVDACVAMIEKLHELKML